jgi:dGTPase
VSIGRGFGVTLTSGATPASASGSFAAGDVLEPAFAADFVAAANDAERARVVVDQIASLTDQSAIDWHNRLVGEIDPAEVGIWTPRHARPGARPAAPAERRSVAEVG